MTAGRYIDEVLEPYVVPFAYNKDPKLVLQHHNARPHIAEIVQFFLSIHNIDNSN